jgi:ribonuclease R
MIKEEAILKLMDDENYKPLKLEELLDALELAPNDCMALQMTLNRLERSGVLVRTKKGKYGLFYKLVQGKFGILHRSHRGFGFVSVEGEKKDIFVPANCTRGAMNGDEVLVKVHSYPDANSHHDHPEGEILRIVKRVNRKIIGIFHYQKKGSFVLPLKSETCDEIWVNKFDGDREINGKMVVVRVITWPINDCSPRGNIVEVLGDPEDPDVIIKKIIRANGINETFSNQVLKEIQSIPQYVSESDGEGRLDLRDIVTVTVDGEDARDFDDAVSIQKLSNNILRLGIHIADVSHYVRKGTYLDEDAYARGTSVYLVDRVIPMLPEELSNGICSLNEGVDRLTVSVFIDCDEEGNRIDHSIYKSVIRVRKRLTYTTVSKIIVDKDEETIREHADLVPMLDLMHDLSRKLRAQRIKEGAVDFDLPETKIVLDENNRPTSVQRAVRDDANQLIEEFMLVANRTVAERLYWMNVPSLYRVHEEPSEEKLSNLKLFLSAIGYRMKKTKSLHPKVFQNILKNFAGRAEEYVVDILLLRSLKLAKYSPENKGHFGLAFDFYTHFTAPIRRYPDLVVHRILKATLDGELTQEYVEDLEKELTEIADHCSEQERLAENAERESEKLMKAEYMVDRIGMEFDGIISGVTSFGIFVMLENTVEGLVSVANLPDDYYEYVSTQYALIGERTRKRYRIGDRVRVQVIGVKPDKGEVDFMLAGVERDVR